MEKMFKAVLKIRWLIIVLVLAITLYSGLADSQYPDQFRCD